MGADFFHKAGWYDTFRTNPFPTLYGPMKTPVTADVLEAGLLFAIGILAFSFLLTLPGLFFKKRFLFLLKAIVGLFILAAIFLCNFGQEWEVAHLHTKTQYKAGISHEITGDIEVKIGLRSVNITLVAGDDEHIVHFDKVNERINYNERFAWDDLGWVQGRGGFGPFAGLVNREYRAAQLKGLPYPILWIAEYFTPDGEGIRWGRYYRQAGYYSHIMLWLAFPLYILSLILVMMVRSYGGVFFAFTGLSMITANLIYGLVRNPTDLAVPFEDGILHFKWGWCFWLCLFTGILNLLISFAILIMDWVAPDMLRDILDVDVAGEYDQFYVSDEELSNFGIKVPDGSRPRKGGPEEQGGGNYRGIYVRRQTKAKDLIATVRGRKKTMDSRSPMYYVGGNNSNLHLNIPNSSYPYHDQNSGFSGSYGYTNPHGYDNHGADMNLDDIAAMTPDPDDLKTMTSHPDMDDYDNMANMNRRLGTGSDVTTGRRLSDDPIYNAAAPTLPPCLRNGSSPSNYPVSNEDIHMSELRKTNKLTELSEEIEEEKVDDREVGEKPPPRPPKGVHWQTRGFDKNPPEHCIYDNAFPSVHGQSRPNRNERVPIDGGQDERRVQLEQRHRPSTATRYPEIRNSTSL